MDILVFLQSSEALWSYAPPCQRLLQ